MSTAEEFIASRGVWRSFESAVAAIKARDLEMWKQGMTDAAAITKGLNAEKFIPEAIEGTRDQTKSV